MEAADVEPAAAASEQSKVSVTGRRRRDPLAAALIGVLTLLLGFAFAVQVRNVGNDQALSGAREEDLVRILDDLNAREERLREQISDQRSALAAADQLRQPVGDGPGGGPQACRGDRDPQRHDRGPGPGADHERPRPR